MFEIPKCYEIVAGRVAGQMHKQKISEKYSFDPLLAIAIAGLIIQVVQCLNRNKRDAQEKFETVQRPNILEKKLLKRAIKHEFKDTDWEQYTNEIYSGMLYEASIIELDEFTTLVNAA